MCLVLAGCLGGSDEPTIEAGATRPDTYGNCGSRLGGATFLSSGGGGAVHLGMTECELVEVLGDPAAATPGPAGPGTRQLTLTYANPDGTGTAYVFVDNALKEMSRVAQVPAVAVN